MGGTYDTRLKKDVSCWIGSEVFFMDWDRRLIACD